MLTEFWDRYAFSIGDRDFTALDVALAAMARGEWSRFERELAEGLACVARAEREGALPSDDALDAAATAFRYDRDLIAAADVTAWLERSRVTSDDWVGYLTRGWLRNQWSDDLDDILDGYLPSARQLLAAAVAEGVCSGIFVRFEQAFAGRAAFVLEKAAEHVQHSGPGAAVPAPVDAGVARLVQTHEHWLSMRPRADTSSRLATVLQIEAIFNQLIDRVAANGRLGEIVEANRVEWMRLELETLSFPLEAAAREAILCIREDGLSLYDVAALSHRAVERRSAVSEEIDADQRDRLLAAEPGRVVGPLAVDGRFDVVALVSRTAPSLTDPDIAVRARQALVDVTIQHAAHNHVTRRD